MGRESGEIVWWQVFTCGVIGSFGIEDLTHHSYWRGALCLVFSLFLWFIHREWR